MHPQLFKIEDLNKTQAGFIYNNPGSVKNSEMALALIDHAVQAMNNQPDLAYNKNRDAYAAVYFLSRVLLEDRKKRPTIFPEETFCTKEVDGKVQKLNMFEYVTLVAEAYPRLSKNLKGEIAVHRKFLTGKAGLKSSSKPQTGTGTYHSHRLQP